MKRNSTIKEENSNSLNKTAVEHKSEEKPIQTIACCHQNHNQTALILFVISVCVALTAINIYELRRIESNHQIVESKEIVDDRHVLPEKRPIYWVHGRNVDGGYLKHVYAVLDRLGYQRGTNDSQWDLLWAHDYPFRALYSQLYNLKPHQKVNHIPGCGYITNKVDLSITEGKYIPKSFKLPEEQDKLLEYARENPKKLFVQKSNAHRGIKIENTTTINFNSTGTFVQEYIDKPFLVDGYKFDIGVYTIITSVNPLRVYIHSADVLFRYCPVEYYPFDPNNLDKYVVGDDYLPTWQVPSLKIFYNQLGFSMKDSFGAYVRSKGKDPDVVWKQINEAIVQICLKKEKQMAAILNRFKSKIHNFFEMVRFDFVLDEDLNVFVMEANMSPNLSSAHYPPNQLLYEQVIFNLMGLVGIANRVRKSSLAIRSQTEEIMLSADKNLVVYANECAKTDGEHDCLNSDSYLCLPCLGDEEKLILTNAYREYLNRGSSKRIFPPPMNQKTDLTSLLANLTEENKWMVKWFYGKCLMDEDWC